jgi:hypothetical protein
MITENNAAVEWHKYQISFLVPRLLPFALLLNSEINILANQFNVPDNRTGDQSMLIGKLSVRGYWKIPIVDSIVVIGLKAEDKRAIA